MAAGFGAVGLGATLAGGMLSAYGAENQGQAQQSMYNYRAQVSRINADIDKQNASWTRQKGDTEAVQYGMKASQQRGAIIGAQSASGLDVNSGSNKEVQRSQDAIKDMDTAQLRANTAKIAYDYETKSTMDENQAKLDVMAGENAATAGHIGALSSILGTVSTVSSKWQQGKSTGLWGGSSGGSGTGFSLTGTGGLY